MKKIILIVDLLAIALCCFMLKVCQYNLFLINPKMSVPVRNPCSRASAVALHTGKIINNLNEKKISYILV